MDGTWYRRITIIVKFTEVGNYAVVMRTSFKQTDFYLRGKGGRKRERETWMWETSLGFFSGTKPVTQAGALTRNRTSDPLLCRMMPNQLSHTSPGYYTCLDWNYFLFCVFIHECIKTDLYINIKCVICILCILWYFVHIFYSNLDFM